MNKLYSNVAAGCGAVFSAFLTDSLAVMVPWLIVMAALITADLIAGTYKALKTGEQVSFSRAVRDTLAKCCTYFSAVVCACMLQVAGDFGFDVAKMTCTLVCLIEGVSIIGNILKWHGITVDLRAVLVYFASKLPGATKEDANNIFKSDK